MIVLEYEAPDGSVIKNPSIATLRRIIETAEPEYWQQGGNGEAGIRVVGERNSLLIKQPPETEQFLFTLLGPSGVHIPYSGGSLDDYTWEERGGDPFKVPVACLVARDTAVRIVEYFAVQHAAFPGVSWISWDDLPDQYQID